jgi:chromate reductase
MNILAFGTSNNTQSINRTLATYTAQLAENASVHTLNIHDYEMPIFSEEREQALGQPPEAKAFYETIAAADALVVSFAEHNGSYSAAWKNLFDWTSRIDKEVFQNKPVVFLSTSPGPGGAASVLASALNSAEFFGARVIASLSVPSFHDNFDMEASQVVNTDIQAALQTAMQQLEKATRTKDRRQQAVA